MDCLCERPPSLDERGRFLVRLDPAYDGGAKLSDHAVCGCECPLCRQTRILLALVGQGRREAKLSAFLSGSSTTLARPKPAQATAPDGVRRFTMIGYTGAAFDIGFGLSVIDISGIDVPSSLPIFRQHDPNQYLGRATSHNRTAQILELSGHFFDTPEALQVARMSDC